MGKSTHLRLSDVRNVFRLLGEVRELGNDPQQWRRYALGGLIRLTGANVGISGLEPVPLQGTLDDVRTLVDVGWESPADRQVYIEFMRSGALLTDPTYQFLKDHPAESFARLRRELVDDWTWYRCPTFDRYHRGGGCDDIIYSRQLVPIARSVDMITLRRAWGDTQFDRRSKQLVVMFHMELARLWRADRTANHGTGLTGTSMVGDLPRHLQQLISQLRLGRSEKEAAAALQLSPHTVHSYVRELYRRLEVRSRGEAMAKLQWTYDFVPRLF